MKNTTLAETILPVRHRAVAPPIEGAYDIRTQRRTYSTDGKAYPADVRASDGFIDEIKISDIIKARDHGGD